MKTTSLTARSASTPEPNNNEAEFQDGVLDLKKKSPPSSHQEFTIANIMLCKEKERERYESERDGLRYQGEKERGRYESERDGEVYQSEKRRRYESERGESDRGVGRYEKVREGSCEDTESEEETGRKSRWPRDNRL